MFGELIKYKRIQKELSINALAKKLDISPSYLMRLEKGENKNPSIAIVIAICDELQINYNEMLKCFSNDEYKYDNNISNNGLNLRINNIINKINEKRACNLKDIINILEEVDNLVDIKPNIYIIAADEITHVVNIKLYEEDKIPMLREGFEKLGYKNIYKVEGKIDVEIIYSVEEIIEFFKENNIDIY